jgi:hypothetical protein
MWCGFRCHSLFGHLMRIIVVPARRATRPLIEHAPEASYREICQVYSVIVWWGEMAPLPKKSPDLSNSSPVPYINALGTGELLLRSGDFFGSGAISPHHIRLVKSMNFLLLYK